MTQEYSDPVLSGWPFWVLELTPDASLSEVDKRARDIQAKLQLGLSGADTFPSPAGVRSRDEFLVREAKAVLIDPGRRLQAELWYVAPVETPAGSEHSSMVDEVEWRKFFGVA